MNRIDDSIYIDNNLIICAEYQMFIDDMRAQGKWFQPDHWVSHQFPRGQAREPIVGVRPSDAIAFCEWLTQHEGKRWRYRIPSLEEAKSYPLSQLELRSFGYWIADSTTLPLAICKANKSEINLTFTIDTVNDEGVARAFAKKPNTDFAVDDDWDYSSYRTYARILALARETSIDLTDAVDRAIARDVNKYSDIEKSFEIALDIIRNHIRDIESVLAGAGEVVQARVRDIDLVCNSNRVFDMDLIKDLGLARDRFLSRSLINFQGRNRDLVQAYAADMDLIIAGLIDVVVNISIPKLRRMGMSVAFEGIRVVKEHGAE